MNKEAKAELNDLRLVAKEKQVDYIDALLSEGTQENKE